MASETSTNARQVSTVNKTTEDPLRVVSLHTSDQKPSISAPSLHTSGHLDLTAATAVRGTETANDDVPGTSMLSPYAYGTVDLEALWNESRLFRGFAQLTWLPCEPWMMTSISTVQQDESDLLTPTAPPATQVVQGTDISSVVDTGDMAPYTSVQLVIDEEMMMEPVPLDDSCPLHRAQAADNRTDVEPSWDDTSRMFNGVVHSTQLL